MTLAQITDSFSVSGELSIADLDALNELGISVLINARFDGESDGQTLSGSFEAICSKIGVRYIHLPVKPGSYSDSEISIMSEALNDSPGKIHAFCKTGTRAVHLWALTQKDEHSFNTLQETLKPHGFNLDMISDRF